MLGHVGQNSSTEFIESKILDFKEPCSLFNPILEDYKTINSIIQVCLSYFTVEEMANCKYFKV